ncbi:MFS transporter [Catenulispora subtropica]|uniref:MFS transporter n=1 Tax=Catenulispora subtropica TaxID=450798 RepID=A0ABN2S9N0_9ACTN
MSQATLVEDKSRAPRSLWRNRDFLLLWSGQTAGAVGPQITLVALPLIALRELRASTFDVSLLTFFGWLPFLVFSLPAGVLADRWDQRRIMICCDLTRLVLLTSLPVLSLAGLLDLWSMYAVVTATGFLTVLFTVAYRSQLPKLISGSQLVDGNGKLGMSESLAEMIGPSIGGLLAGVVGASRALYGNVTTYAISALALRMIREPAQPAGTTAPSDEPDAASSTGATQTADDEPETVRASIKSGLAYVLHERVLRALLICTSLSNFFVIAVSAIGVAYLARTLHAAPVAIGLTFTGGAVGGLVAGGLAARVSRRVGSARIIWLSMAVPGPFYLLMPLARPGWGVALYAVGTAAYAAAVTFFNASAISYRQTVCPPRLLNRVNSAYLWLAYGSLPLGSLFGGALGTALGLRTTVLVCVLGAWAVSLFVIFSPLRGMRDIPEAAPSAT